MAHDTILDQGTTDPKSIISTHQPVSVSRIYRLTEIGVVTSLTVAHLSMNSLNTDFLSKDFDSVFLLSAET